LRGTAPAAGPPRPALRIGTLAMVLTAAAVVLWSTRAPALLSSWMLHRRAAPARIVLPTAAAAVAPPVVVATKVSAVARPRRARAASRPARQHAPRRERAPVIERDDTWGRRH
jgi:hypothetical protein